MLKPTIHFGKNPSSGLFVFVDGTGFSFKILTVNTHKGFTLFNRRFMLHELRDAVRLVSAEVVCLQEVIGEHREHSERFPEWPDVSHYEFLADVMWPEFAYGRNAVYPAGDHGNALLSKFPIQHYLNRDISVRGAERRGLLHCVLYLPHVDRALNVICVHLGLREAHRRRQLELLCHLLKTEVGPQTPVVVAGDFNDWQLRAHRTLIDRTGLQEAFVETQGKTARSFPARWPLLRLDRVYLRNARVREARVLSTRPWSHLSDHAPLFVEVEL